MSDLAAALQVAIRVHADQRDKQGEPYLLHVLRVVEAVGDEAKVVAALHDVFEDAERGLDNTTVEQVGLSMGEALGIALLTRKNARETYADYIAGIARNVDLRGGSLAREVKLADLRDNLGRIPPHPGTSKPSSVGAEWERHWAALKARYEKAIAVLGEHK